MCEVIVCKSDSEFLCFPFNDNPYEDNYPNNIPQTNFKLKWLDNKEDMLKLLDYINNSDNLKNAEDYEFLYEYVTEDYYVYEECFLGEMKQFLSDFCIINNLHNEGKYNTPTFICKLNDLLCRPSTFIKCFLSKSNDIFLDLKKDIDFIIQIVKEINRVSTYYTYHKDIEYSNIDVKEIAERVIKDFIYEKLYEEVDNYYGYDNDEILKGEIN